MYTVTCNQARDFPLTLDHVTERLRVVLHARVFDFERLVYLSEETTPVRSPEEVDKVTVVPLKVCSFKYGSKYEQKM